MNIYTYMYTYVCVHKYVYIYIYIYTHAYTHDCLSSDGVGAPIPIARQQLPDLKGSAKWVALLVQPYLFNAASFILCVFRRVKDDN